MKRVANAKPMFEVKFRSIYHKRISTLLRI